MLFIDSILYVIIGAGAKLTRRRILSYTYYSESHATIIQKWPNSARLKSNKAKTRTVFRCKEQNTHIIRCCFPLTPPNSIIAESLAPGGDYRLYMAVFHDIIV